MKSRARLSKRKHLVIGVGQIGQAIASILKADTLDIRQDRTSYSEGHYAILHICFPYFKGFSKQVKKYQKRFSPDLTIIHSTVPIGTTKLLDAVHSPCRGLHPDLEKATRVFVKYFGGKKANRAALYFSELGIKTKCTRSSDNTEAVKLWDTTIYGWNIILEKMIHSHCKKYDLDFDLVYSGANKTYNEGYEIMGHPEYKKYILKHVDGKIGGHCVMPNLSLLDSEVSKSINKFNKKLA